MSTKELADTGPDSPAPSSMLGTEARKSWGARIADDVAATHELMRETRNIQVEQARTAQEQNLAMMQRFDRAEEVLARLSDMLTDASLVAMLNHEEIMREVAEIKTVAEEALKNSDDALQRTAAVVLSETVQ